jgi:hypothetical protein
VDMQHSESCGGALVEGRQIACHRRRRRIILSEVHLYLEQREEWWCTSNTGGAMAILVSVEEDPCIWIVGCTDTLGASIGFVGPL